MLFNLVNMINEIKKIDGVSVTDKDFFEYFFGTLSVNKELNCKPLAFDPPRISEVMNGKDTLYESVAKLAYKPETKKALMEAINKAKRDLFKNVDVAKINEVLRKMTIDDQSFNDDIQRLSNENKNDEVFAQYVLRAMKLEYEERQLKKKYKIATGNFITKKADATICSEIIEQITRNKKLKIENVKHERAWSLEDKMTINNFNEPLKDQILEAFDDYETVMTAIDNLSMVEIQARKTLYSNYKSAYLHVLSSMFDNNYEENDIKKSSSTIFMAVDDFIYEQNLKGKIKIEEDLVRYNLFCITVVVFYQCKFLLRVNEETK